MKVYLKKYHSCILLMAVLTFLFHSAKLDSAIIGIDTEDLIHLQNDFYGGWLTTGRQGLVFLKALFANMEFNPYYAGLMTLLLLSVASFSLFALLDQVLPKSYASWMAGGILFLAHPILTEQLYFSLQSMEICIGLFLTVCSLFMILKWTIYRKKRLLVGSTLLLLLTFSIYQVFVVVFIFGAVALLLAETLRGLKEQAEHAFDVKSSLLSILPFFLVFLAAFVLNSLITNLFFHSSSYLGEQIQWGKIGFANNIRLIIQHIGNVLTGQLSIYYFFGYGLIYLILLALILGFYLKYGKSIASFVLLLFYYIALMATPFLMTLVCGAAPAIRSQLVLPLSSGVLGYLCVFLLQDFCQNKWLPQKTIVKRFTLPLTIVVAAVCSFTGLAELKTTMSLYYTDECRYEEDAFIGRDLIQKIEQVSLGEDLPIIVVGHRAFVGNNACVQGEVIGRSFFDYDTEVEPLCYWSTRRMIGFFHTLGADYTMVNEDRIVQAMYHSTFMPSWPAQDSVKVIDGMVVIKLSHYE